MKLPYHSAVLLSLLFSLPAPAEQITVAVASNFYAPLHALAERFQAHTSHQINIASGSSGKIFAQISHGAPFSLFFSADQAKPAALEAKQLAVAGSRFTYAVGRLALWSNSRETPDQLSQRLQQHSYRKLAIANPRLAPYGVAAHQVLENLQLTASSRPHWVMGENIAQTFQFVRSGSADLGFVAFSQIHDSHNQGWLIPESLHQPIRQDAVILQRAASSEAALAFVRFIQSKEGREIIHSFGYSTPLSENASQ
ncbi:molybdate ABC transporter substrate-binding protein [Neptuniibacter halophilus]|uniref:molybdate ABC transporter substrate-binding protein n=1 Tax=Neptuniibacter halophilus TaxID=651666 RepID=UPI00257305AF|nr:molybdate ABC transporter substrate-binding protein [Neptuniibacter halophilus]